MIDSKYSEQTRMCDDTHNPPGKGIEKSDTRFSANAGTASDKNKEGKSSLTGRCQINAQQKILYLDTGLKFIAPVERNRTGSQIEILNTLETGVSHQLLQFFLRGVYTDRFGEVAIAILVFGNQFSHRRQHLE